VSEPIGVTLSGDLTALTGSTHQSPLDQQLAEDRYQVCWNIRRSARGPYADVVCTENITNLFVHSNGNVYFTTTATCAGWCEISFATPAANNQAYAMLLTANAQGAPVTFDGPNLTSCPTQNQVYASPGWIDLP
jgi:hypothetical protein